MKNALFWALLICPYVLYGQFYDDFTHGLNAWSGDTSKFTVDPEGRLRLNDSKGGSARVYRRVQQLDTSIWSGRVDLEFQPSNSNKLRIVFQSEDTTLLNGWYAEIGESGQSDSMRFYSITDGLQDKLGAVFLPNFSTDQVQFEYFIEVNHNDLRIFITDTLDRRDSVTFSSDIILGPPFFFQLQCQYTTTRASKFAFDDIAVGQLKIDTMPVEIVDIDAFSSRDILIQFSESIDTSSVGQIHLTSTSIIEDFSFSQDGLSLHILTEDALVSGQWYELIVENISDLYGNLSDTLRGSFQYKEVTTAGAYDVLITELMADPQPVRAMPDCEYVELYNRTDQYIQLADFTVADLTRQAFLPEYLLAPQEYVVLCDESCLDALSRHGNAIAVDDLPSLNNDADAIGIVDFVGRIIHQVNYDRSWYSDDSQSEGGWSLEMIETEDVCAGKKNWRAAEFAACGSPGASNTVSGEGKRDTLAIDRALAISGHQVEVVFSHSLLTDPDHLNLEMSHNIRFDRVEIEKNIVNIALRDSLQSGIGYQIRLSDVRDCLDRVHTDDFEVIIYRPKAADSSQLIINEVLFDGTSELPKFIELHNPTSSFLQVERLCMECRSSSDTTFECLDEPIIIKARDFLVWTEDTALLSREFSREGHWLEAPLPKLHDEAGHLNLFSYSNWKRKMLDQSAYKVDWHSPVLLETEAVSLERRRYHVSGLIRDNWHSASSVDNYATPGRVNSSEAEAQGGKDFVKVLDKCFSPNGDGYKDFIEVQVNPDKPGYNLRLDVYDIEGHFIRRLSDDDLVNGPNFFVWDGADQHGHVRSIGVYLILLEMGHPDGDLHRQKVSVILN